MRRLSLVAALGVAACLPLGDAGGADAPGRATYLGTYVWDVDAPWFGGFSGLHLDPDGLGFLALSDRARLVAGRLERGPDGVVTGVEAGRPERLLDVEGNPLRGRRADSEGLAVADGRVFVSFEDLARVREEGTPPRLLPTHPDWERLGENSALESLAADADGRLYAIPEHPPPGERDFAVYRWDGAAWTVAWRFARRGDFDVSDAAVGPDGRLYVLEREFTGLGFRSRLRRFGLDGGGEMTLLETPTGTHDNLEGLAVWRDAGGLRATMIADDNFRFFQRTELVDLRLPD